MKKFSIVSVLLAFLMWTSAHSQEPSDVPAYINAIKMNPAMLYGEATCMAEDEARSQAFAELKLAYEEYSSTHKGTCLDTSKVSYLKTMRGSNTRILAFIPVDSIEIGKQETEFNIKWLEKDLIQAKTWGDVASTITKEPYASYISAGAVDLSTKEDVLKKSYLLVLRGNGKFVANIYSPCDENMSRTELKSGQKGTAIEYKKGDSVFWVGCND